jgi:hypothetical protein
MATIADIRKQYPQYNDLSDEQLAQGFHQKFYSDIPYEQFKQQIGLTAQPTQPAEPPSRMEQMFGLGSPIARFAKGAVVNPLLGINQMLAETGVFGEQVRQGARQQVQQYEQATKAARERVGSTGTDFVELAGAVASPTMALTAPRVAGPAAARISQALPGAATAPINQLAAQQVAARALPTTSLERIGTGAATGAAFAGMQPVENPVEYLDQKLEQMGTGALFGTLVSGGIETASKAKKIVTELYKPLTKEGRLDILRKYFNDLSGGKKDEVIKALQSADEIVPGSRPTAAEAVSNIPQATGLAAFQQQVSRQAPETGAPGAFAARAAEQQAARSAQLQTLGGTETNITAAKAQREALTAPLRQEALEQANIAGQVGPRLEAEIASKYQSKTQALQAAGRLQTEGAQQAQLSRNFFPVPGFPRVSPEFSQNYQRVVENLEGAKTAANIGVQRQAEREFKQFQLQSLADNGFFPLRTNEIVGRIDDILQRPGEARTSSLIRRSLSEVRDELNKFTNPDGIINSADLYGIRKNIGNILRKNADETGTFDEKLLTKYSTNLKTYIDAAINKSIGATEKDVGSWTRYLRTYEQASQKINRMEIGEFLERKLQTPLGDKERVGVFAQAVQDAAQTIKKSTGVARFQKLDEILSPDQIGSINKIIADLQRTAKAQELAGRSATGTSGMTTAELPNLLNRYAAITNTVLRALKKDSVTEINKVASELLLEPQKLAAFIQGVPPGKANIVAEALLKRVSPELRDGLSRALAVSREELAGGATRAAVQGMNQ